MTFFVDNCEPPEHFDRTEMFNISLWNLSACLYIFIYQKTDCLIKWGYPFLTLQTSCFMKLVYTRFSESHIEVQGKSFYFRFFTCMCIRICIGLHACHWGSEYKVMDLVLCTVWAGGFRLTSKLVASTRTHRAFCSPGRSWVEFCFVLRFIYCYI